MIPRFLTLWEKLRSSLWAVPLLMTAVAAAAAILAVNVQIDTGSDPVWFLYSGDAASAPQFLAHLVTAMITMATLAISITMVVLTLAAQQLGPRLIQSFMRDWHTQFALGLFVATVVYLLLVLRNTYGASDSAPNLAVTIGTALVLVSVVVALVFVHHLARSIIADNVIQSVGDLLDEEIGRLLPDKDAPSLPRHVSSARENGADVRISDGGYVQTIDFEQAVQIACDSDLVIEFGARAGQHIIARSVVAWIVPHPAASDEIRSRIAGCVRIGRERTSVQDLEFSVRHLVEIAVRALSTGINDPYTAMAVVDRLALAIGHAMTRGPARGQWADRNGDLRVIAPVSTFEGLVDAAFHQIRERAANAPDVLIRLAEKLSQLIEQADERQRAVLAKHLQLVLKAGRRSIAEEHDLDALEHRAGPALDDIPVAPSRARASGT
jgi:uncharacterized membrane protein